MARGGIRTGAGRPKGAANVRTQEIANGAIADGITPLDYLLSILRDANAEQSVRIDVAKAAAPYVHPRLATVDLGNKDDKPFALEARWADTPSEATPDPSNPS